MVGMIIKGFILCAAGLAAYYFTQESLGKKAAMWAAVIVASILALLFKGC